MYDNECLFQRLFDNIVKELIRLYQLHCTFCSVFTSEYKQLHVKHNDE